MNLLFTCLFSYCTCKIRFTGACKPLKDATLKDYQDAVTVREAGKYLGFEYNRIADWCEKGLLKAIPYQFNYRIPKTYLINFVAHMEIDGLWSRRTVGYKKLINDYAVWKLKKDNAASGRGK